MIGQTFAIFVDAYRDLNARKLFWVTLILSALVVITFALFGTDAKGLSIVTFHMDVPNAPVLYKLIFTSFVIGFWLTWAATVLALVSTAGIFPDFIGGGSIDLYLAKPIGRARLFVTKYVAGLLFVTLQVVVITVGSFFVLGLRGHEWNPGLFWAIPIVVCFFSYLFAVCVLLGVKTRSTIAALLLTILCWTMFALLDRAEPQLLTGQNMYASRAQQEEGQADLSEANLRHAEQEPKDAALLPALREDAASARRDAEADAHSAKIFRNIHRVVYGIKTVTPKTTDTINLLDRYIFSADEGGYREGMARNRGAERSGDSDEAMMAGAEQTARDLQSRSPAWIIGTSLAFEVVLVGAAMWIFCRRDY